MSYSRWDSPEVLTPLIGVGLFGACWLVSKCRDRQEDRAEAKANNALRRPLSSLTTPLLSGTPEVLPPAAPASQAVKSHERTPLAKLSLHSPKSSAASVTLDVGATGEVKISIR